MKTKFTIIYDNDRHKRGLKTGWGFSALIEAGNNPPVLFDTGDNGASLLYNMNALAVDPKAIGSIVISHAHGDHTGGLPEILEVNSRATVYVPASVAADIPGRKVVSVRRPLEISKNIHSTGELRNIEQSLAVETSRGIIAVTGCSHPGVGLILDAAASFGKVYGIIGGLHGFREFSRLEGLSLVCPCHCTQYKDALADSFPDKVQTCGAGLELQL